MSIKKGITGSILIISVGLSVYFFRHSNKPITPSPLILQSKFSSKGVVDRIIQLELKFDEVKTNSEKALVTAEISMPFDFNDKLYFRWKLGQDVYITEGSLTGEIIGLTKNETKKIYLTVTGFSKETNHHIGFEVYGIKNGKNIFGDALIASDLESTFENTVQNVERIKASQ